jgi:hypothetical protein
MAEYINTPRNNSDNLNRDPKTLYLTTSTTIVTGVTSQAKYLLCDINDKNAALPIYKFQYSQPDIDLLVPYTDFSVKNATILDDATPYGAGIVVKLNATPATSANNDVQDYALPLWKPTEELDIVPSVRINTPTIASNILSADRFLVASLDNEAYGIPLATYDRVYPFTNQDIIAPSAVDVTTEFYVNTVRYDSPRSAGSTNLNSKIRTYSNLINRIKTQIGHPFVNLEVCDDAQIVEFIDMSMEWYTKYAGYTEEFLIFSSDMYKEPGLQIDKLFSITPTMREATSKGLSGSWDYDLADYRKVVGVFTFEPGESTGINTLFTLEQAMAQQTYFSYQLGNVGFDLVTWEVLKQWLDLREKVLAQKHYVDFNQHTQTLRLLPAPLPTQHFYGVVGAWVEQPISQLLSEQWIQKYTLALTKIAIGNVRGKYQGMQMFGGGTINYNDLLSQGLREKEELEKGLQEGTWYETAPPRFFIG